MRKNLSKVLKPLILLDFNPNHLSYHHLRKSSAWPIGLWDGLYRSKVSQTLWWRYETKLFQNIKVFLVLFGFFYTPYQKRLFNDCQTNGGGTDPLFLRTSLLQFCHHFIVRPEMWSTIDIREQESSKPIRTPKGSARWVGIWKERATSRALIAKLPASRLMNWSALSGGLSEL